MHAEVGLLQRFTYGIVHKAAIRIKLDLAFIPVSFWSRFRLFGVGHSDVGASFGCRWHGHMKQAWPMFSSVSEIGCGECCAPQDSSF